MTFEHIKGTENILADHISRFRCRSLNGRLDPEKGGLSFNITYLNPPTSMEQVLYKMPLV